jgi:Amidohydrolase family
MIVEDGYRRSRAGDPELTDFEIEYGDPQIAFSFFDVNFPFSIRKSKTKEELKKLGSENFAIPNNKTYWDIGYNVLVGTDAGNPGTMHGVSFFQEMDAMIESGLTHGQALKAATVNAARMLKIEKEIGTVEVGKKADLIVLNNDPLVGFETLKSPAQIYKEGVLLAYKEPLRKRVLRVLLKAQVKGSPIFKKSKIKYFRPDLNWELDPDQQFTFKVPGSFLKEDNTFVKNAVATLTLNRKTQKITLKKMEQVVQKH